MLWSKFEHLFEEGWGEKLRPFIESEECDKIYKRLKEDSNPREGRIICPASENVWRAFKVCPWNKLKVVIIGLDPYPYYYNKKYVADGLAFSCSSMEKFQPSLEVLYQAIEDDAYKGLALNYTKPFDLTYLAEQGVLLLNSALTVEKEKIGSHTELWQPFMRWLIMNVLNTYCTGLVYILMGKIAQGFHRDILPFNHWVMEVEHPSFANRKERKMLHQNCFSKTNTILKNNNGEAAQIDWLKPVKD